MSPSPGPEELGNALEEDGRVVQENGRVVDETCIALE
jgi:hypothetical protein